MPGVWKQAALRRREEVARSRILGAVAIGWVFTLPVLFLSIVALSHPRDRFLFKAGGLFLVIALFMAGVTELIRRGNKIAIGALLGLMVLSQVRAVRLLHGSYWGWSAALWIIIIAVLANGLWGAFELETIRQRAAASET